MTSARISFIPVTSSRWCRAAIGVALSLVVPLACSDGAGPRALSNRSSVSICSATSGQSPCARPVDLNNSSDVPPSVSSVEGDLSIAVSGVSQERVIHFRSARIGEGWRTVSTPRWDKRAFSATRSGPLSIVDEPSGARSVVDANGNSVVTDPSSMTELRTRIGSNSPLSAMLNQQFAQLATASEPGHVKLAHRQRPQLLLVENTSAQTKLEALEARYGAGQVTGNTTRFERSSDTGSETIDFDRNVGAVVRRMVVRRDGARVEVLSNFSSVRPGLSAQDHVVINQTRADGKSTRIEANFSNISVTETGK